MRGVGVGVAAAVGSEHFDRDLRGHRALHDRLGVHDLVHHYRFAVGAVDGLAAGVGLRTWVVYGSNVFATVYGGILDHALRDEGERDHQADRHEQ